MALTHEQYKTEFENELKNGDWIEYYRGDFEFTFSDGTETRYQQTEHITDTRWHKVYQVVHQLPDDTYVSWDCFIGATEFQEHEVAANLRDCTRVEETVVVVKFMENSPRPRPLIQ